MRRQKIYRSIDGKAPFDEWINGLKDVIGRGKIKIRTDRVLQGNLGDYRSVGMGVIELRIHYGPGYRVYVGLDGLEIVVLLCGGDKSTQERDIVLAHGYWADYRMRRESGRLT